MANSVDPDQAPRIAAPDLGLNYLLRPFCPNTEALGGLSMPRKSVSRLTVRLDMTISVFTGS